MTQAPHVVAVARDPGHNVVKPTVDSITLIEAWGVEGDAHAGKTVQHRHDKRRNPDAPNLRQVHLIHAELHDEVNERGMAVGPGQMGENITTRGVDLLALPRGTVLRIGEAAIEVTGLRNPCKYLNDIAPGLMKACLGKRDDGSVLARTGVMGVILRGGEVRADDNIIVELPAEPHQWLEPV